MRRLVRIVWAMPETKSGRRHRKKFREKRLLKMAKIGDAAKYRRRGFGIWRLVVTCAAAMKA